MYKPYKYTYNDIDISLKNYLKHVNERIKFRENVEKNLDTINNEMKNISEKRYNNIEKDIIIEDVKKMNSIMRIITKMKRKYGMVESIYKHEKICKISKAPSSRDIIKMYKNLSSDDKFRLYSYLNDITLESIQSIYNTSYFKDIIK